VKRLLNPSLSAYNRITNRTETEYFFKKQNDTFITKAQPNKKSLSEFFNDCPEVTEGPE